MTTALPESLAESWQAAGTRSGTSTVMVMSISAETTVYEPIETAASLAKLGASDMPVRSLFTVDMTFSPSLATFGVSPKGVFSMAVPKAKGQFVDIVEDEGLVVEGTRETHSFEAANGTSGKWFVLDVVYPLASELATEQTDRLAAETHIAIWPTETTYGMAGGTVPLELPAGVGDAIDGEIPVNPAADRERIAELVRSIDPETTDEA